MKKIHKAIFPVAGLGTRFLPATKASPKEMLPVVDKPLIQYAVEDAIQAGLDTLIFVTGRNKRAIENHFDRMPELEQRLEAKAQHRLLEEVRNILPSHVQCIYIRQPEPKGLGDAILCAQPIIGDETFAVLLADDLLLSDNRSSTKQMVKFYSDYHGCFVMIESVEPEKVCNYGVIEGEQLTDTVWKIDHFVEKPKPEEAPSHLAAIGRYLLTPDIFAHLKQVSPDANGEIQLTDAIARQAKSQPVYAVLFEGKRYDCGSKLGYLQASIELALSHEQVKDDFKHYLKHLKL